jgi:two-component system, chemotaxis family, chemotaxis protein CheY
MKTATLTGHSRGDCRILYAEDEPHLRVCLSRCLVRAGYRVTAVADGQQAWEMLQCRPFDLVITDHHMPRLTGGELILKLRVAGLGMATLITTSDPEFFDDARRSFLRIDAVLLKPFGLGQFFDTIDRALGRDHSAISMAPLPGAASFTHSH